MPIGAKVEDALQRGGKGAYYVPNMGEIGLKAANERIFSTMEEW